MKRGLITVLTLVFISIFLVNFVSAQFGGYGFSPGNFLNTLDLGEILVFGSIFGIIFGLIFWALSRLPLFRDAYGQPNKVIPAVISLGISFLIIYYGFYNNNFNFGGFPSSVGVSSDLLYPLFGLILIGLMIFIIWKINFHLFLMILGLATLGVTLFTDIVYEKGVTLIAGAVLVFLGLMLWIKSRGRLNYDFEREKSKGKWGWLILGILLVVLGFILGQFYVIGAGVIIGLIGLWIWTRKHPGGMATRNYAGDKYSRFRDPRRRLEAYEEKMNVRNQKESSKKRLQMLKERQKAYKVNPKIAEEEAYREEAKRNEIARVRERRQAYEEVKKMTAQIEELKDQERLIGKAVIRNTDNIEKTNDSRQKSDLQKAIVGLENQKREIYSRIRELKRAIKSLSDRYR